jgi:hypothetical protein
MLLQKNLDADSHLGKTGSSHDAKLHGKLNSY